MSRAVLKLPTTADSLHCRDYAVHAQFGMDLRSRDEVGRLLNIVPSKLLLHLHQNQR